MKPLRHHVIRSTKLVLILALLLTVFVRRAGAQTTSPTTAPANSEIPITGVSHVQRPMVAEQTTQSKLELYSSDQRLIDVFNWAKSQAMAYVFDGDPVGPWYEAVEPGREGFCVRDTCHQAMGAHALGLDRWNLNMLRRFAENVTDSKDFCTYWEINRYNKPAPVDYKNDAEFWYNLPANFDLVDCCYRMYVWTGDETYVNDPALLNLYDRTVNDYVDRWALGLDQIMKRPRLLNVRGILDPTKKFPKNRGIPGYDEKDKTYVIGFDVIATQYAAYRAYANIQAVRGNTDLAETFAKKAEDVKALAMKSWWSAKDNAFYARLNKDYQLESPGQNRRAKTLDWGTEPYDDPDTATAQVLNLDGVRLEYPEVSFSRIGTIVTGTMGINVIFSSPLEASKKGLWVEATIQTKPGLGKSIEWAEIDNLPIRANTVAVRQIGMRKTIFTNQHGPAVIWRPVFDGSHEQLIVNGAPAKAHLEAGNDGKPITSLRVTVGAGGSVTVEVPSK
jgi:hypothetical protein